MKKLIVLFLCIAAVAVIVACEQDENVPSDMMQVHIVDIEELSGGKVEFTIAIKEVDFDQIVSLQLEVVDSIDFSTTKYDIGNIAKDTVRFVADNLPALGSFSAQAILHSGLGYLVASPTLPFTTESPDLHIDIGSEGVISDLSIITVRGSNLLSDRFGIAIKTRRSPTSPEELIPLTECTYKSDSLMTLLTPQLATSPTENCFFESAIQPCKLYVYNLKNKERQRALADVTYKYLAYVYDTKILRGDEAWIFLEVSCDDLIAQISLHLGDIKCTILEVHDMVVDFGNQKIVVKVLSYSIPPGTPPGRYTVKLTNPKYPDCLYFGKMNIVTVL